MLLRRKPFGPLLPSAHAVDRCTKRYRLSETETMEEMERLTAWGCSATLPEQLAQKARNLATMPGA